MTSHRPSVDLGSPTAAASRDERASREHFREKYAAAASTEAAEIERRVLGASWGANGYTTLSQADDLVRRLTLRPGALVLDLGTGRGWPGLYMAARTSCALVGVELSFDALVEAAQRARDERLDERVATVVAAAGSLPFRPMSFDAIVHTDVLC
jgi:SAM-dependent methyltransferase